MSDLALMRNFISYQYNIITRGMFIYSIPTQHGAFIQVYETEESAKKAAKMMSVDTETFLLPKLFEETETETSIRTLHCPGGFQEMIVSILSICQIANCVGIRYNRGNKYTDIKVGVLQLWLKIMTGETTIGHTGF